MNNIYPTIIISPPNTITIYLKSLLLNIKNKLILSIIDTINNSISNNKYIIISNNNNPIIIAPLTSQSLLISIIKLIIRPINKLDYTILTLPRLDLAL